jgi:hypothetical protein
MKHTLLLVLLVSTLMSSLAPGQPAPSDSSAKPKAAAEVHLMGTLEQRVAIGDETTGWALRHGDKQRVELLLPVEAFAWIRDGLVVSVSGVHGTKHYPERGNVAVFTVKKISEVVR